MFMIGLHFLKADSRVLVNDTQEKLKVIFLESLLFYDTFKVSSFLMMFDSPRRRLGLTHLLRELGFIFITLDSCYNSSLSFNPYLAHPQSSLFLTSQY